jgi:predicted phage terminase large subunit-like protein
VFRRRLEYPALKRAVREQQALFAATEVLIEDKASGTQLIQELIVEGCHGVTRYEPTTEKIMRLHAQTAIIENGFVHIPETAPWLAEYLHEMTVFPKGKHDDQVDSTAQFLDWFKRPSPGWAYFECMRMQMQAQQNAGNPERHRVCLRAAGDVASVQTLSGRHIIIGPDRTVEMSAEDAESLIRAGWTKLGAWIDDEPAEYDQINNPNAPEGPQINYAVDSMEWRAQVEKELDDRKAILQEEEKRRLARLAAFLGKKT